MGEPPVRKLARVEPSGGLDLDGRSVFEAPREFGVTGRRMADGKWTFHSESQTGPELSAQPQLAVRGAKRFFCIQELSDNALTYAVRE
jgi:hypothetical protein